MLGIDLFELQRKEMCDARLALSYLYCCTLFLYGMRRRLVQPHGCRFLGRYTGVLGQNKWRKRAEQRRCQASLNRAQ